VRRIGRRRGIGDDRGDEAPARIAGREVLASVPRVLVRQRPLEDGREGVIAEARSHARMLARKFQFL